MHKKLWGVVILVAPLLAGCASSFDDDFGGNDVAYNDSSARYDGALPRETGKSRIEENGQAPLECVPFARDHSGVKIFGDAYTWWDQAAAKYERSGKPASGAVMVLSGYAGPERGHVAVVQKIVSSREIRVDHANWLDDGGIYINDPVTDVSAANDWSQVRVFNIQTGAWGGNIYPVKGFILPQGGAQGGMQDAPDVEAPAPQNAPVTARVQKKLLPKPRPAPRPQAVSPQAEPPQAQQPLGSHDLTPEDLELEPESAGNPGPVALAETPKKAR